METKPRWILWAGIALGAILIFAAGGFVGALIYHEVKPEREASQPVKNRTVSWVSEGLTVLEIVPDSPAEAAGIVPGDTLLQIDETKLDATINLADLIAAYQPGDEIQITLHHAGSSEDAEVEVTLGENPDQTGAAYLGIRYRSQSASPMGWLPPAGRDRRIDPGDKLPGLLEDYDQIQGHLHFLESCQDARLQTEDSEAVCGLIVVQVATASPAETAGIKIGDMILALDGEGLTTRQAFIEAIQAHQPGDPISLTVYHLADDTQDEVDVKLGENPESAGQAYLGVTVPGFYIDIGGSVWPPLEHMPGFRQLQPDGGMSSPQT